MKMLAPDPLRVLPPLTDRQAKCLEYILNYFLENRYYPTQREVAQAMDIQSSTAEMYLQPLVEKGYLMRERNKNSKRGKQRNIRGLSRILCK
jgi:DNA-binding MarR family transcriptional regulator